MSSNADDRLTIGNGEGYGKMDGRGLASLVLLVCSSSAFAQGDGFLPIRVKCPQHNGGVMETVQQNSVGQRERIRITFDDADKIIAAELAAAENGQGYDIFAISGAELAQPDASLYAQDLLNRAMQLGGSLCRDPSEFQRVDDKLKRNRSLLGIQ